MSGRISILITHYGYAGYLVACVESARNQSYEDIEIVVIDDASPGDSAESILLRAGVKVERIIRNTDQIGYSASLKLALEAATGDYILPLDSDDLLQPEFCKLTLSQLIESNADVCYTAVRFFGEIEAVVDDEITIVNLLAFSSGHQSILYRRSLMEKVNGFRAGSVSVDCQLLIDALVKGAVLARLTQPLYWYRQHGSGMSKQSFDERIRQRVEINRQLYIDNLEPIFRRSVGEYEKLLDEYRHVLDGYRLVESDRLRMTRQYEKLLDWDQLADADASGSGEDSNARGSDIDTQKPGPRFQAKVFAQLAVRGGLRSAVLPAANIAFTGLSAGADRAKDGHDQYEKRVLRICAASAGIAGPSRSGGLDAHYTNLSEALARAGHDVTILYASENCEVESVEYWQEEFAKKQVKFEPLPSYLRQNLTNEQMQASYEAYRWLKEKDFDIIHFPEYLGLGYYTLLAKHQGLAFQNTLIRVGAHSSTAWCNEASGRFPDSLDELILEFMEKESLERADIVISPSQYYLNWLSRNGIRLPAKSYVQHGIVTPEARLSGHTPIATRHTVDEVVFFGRLEERKGLRIFCEAVDRLVGQDVPDFSITFMGRVMTIEGRSAADYIADRAQRWPFKWQIISDKDRIEAVSYLRGGKRLAVMPSLDEVWGQVVMECIGSDIPFLTSNAGGMAESIAAEDIDKVTFAPNAAELATSLIQVLAQGAYTARPSLDPDQNEKIWIEWHNNLAAEEKFAVDDAPIDFRTPADVLAARPLVTVCVSHIDTVEHLFQTISSLDQQDYANTELIVVDDAANAAAIDSLPALMPTLVAGQRPFLRLENRTREEPRNLAARHARGRYLLFMDGKSCAKPHQLSTMVSVALITGADITTCGVDYFSGKHAPAKEQLATSTSIPLGAATTACLSPHLLGESNALIAKESFFRLGGFSEQGSAEYKHRELFAKAVALGFRLEAIPETLYWRRVNQNSQVASYLDHKSLLKIYENSVSNSHNDYLPIIKGLLLRTEALRHVEDEYHLLEPEYRKILDTYRSLEKAYLSQGERLAALQEAIEVVSNVSTGKDAVGDQENHLSAVDDQENHPSAVDDQENHSSAVDDQENHSSAVDDQENHPSAVDDQENHPSAVDDQENHPSAADAAENNLRTESETPLQRSIERRIRDLVVHTSAWLSQGNIRQEAVNEDSADDKNAGTNNGVNDKNLLSDLETLRASGLINAAFYKQQCARMDLKFEDAAAHYLDHGWKHDLSPSQFFNSPYYRQEAAARGIEITGCPALHFLHEGFKIGLNPSEKFDVNWYLAEYPDVRKAGMNPLTHFVRFGFRENRKPLPKAAESKAEHFILPNSKVVEQISADANVLVALHEGSRTGAPMLAHRLLRELKTRNLNLKVLVAKDGSLVEELQSEFDTFVLPLAWADEETTLAYLQLVASHIPDLSSYVVILSSAEVWNLAKFFKERGCTVYTLIHEYMNRYPDYARAPIWEYSDKVIFSAMATQKVALELPGARQQSARLLPQGLIDEHYLNVARSVRRQDSIRRELEISADATMVLSCGSPSLRKGIDIFVRLARRYHLNFGAESPAVFCWVGVDTPEFDQNLPWLIRDMASHGLNSVVKLIPSQADLTPYFAAADLFLLPSREDPLPNVVQYAMASALPVVAFASAGGTEELLAKGGGKVTPFLDIDAMATAVYQYSVSPEMREKDGDRGRHIIESEYNFSKYADSLLADELFSPNNERGLSLSAAGAGLESAMADSGGVGLGSSDKTADLIRIDAKSDSTASDSARAGTESKGTTPDSVRPEADSKSVTVVAERADIMPEVRALESCFTHSMPARPHTEDFSEGNLSPSVLQWLIANVKHGEQILEFGSGKSSRELAKFFDVTSIEHNVDYADYSYSNVKYVIAPLENGTYSNQIIRPVLDHQYSVVILDGPPAYQWENRFSRLGFLKTKNSLAGNPILVIDDAQRVGEFYIVLKTGLMNKQLRLFCWSGKACVILIPGGSNAFFGKEFWRLFKMAAPNLLYEVKKSIERVLNFHLE
jgi:O-antigen biosynthesis protein